MFDLDTAIATWRASLTWKRSIDKEDRDELERHVRDAVAEGVLNGMSEEDAFRTAIRRMGQLPQIDREYRKIYWGKLRKRRRLEDELAWRAAMLKNYFTIALRLLIKQRIYAVINIFDLAVGIAFCLLLLLYVRDELTYDAGHENGDRIARVIYERFMPDGSVERAHPYMAYPVGKALEAEHAGVEMTSRLYQQEIYVRQGDATTEEDVLFGDPSLLSMFTFPLIEGDRSTALPEPGGLVISRKMANRYFPGESAVGKELEFRFEDLFVPVMITGVAENIPDNNSVKFDFLMPFERLKSEYEWIAKNEGRWNASSYFVYALLQPGTTVESAQSALADFRQKYYGDWTERARENEDWTAEHDPYGFRFQPLSDIHLNTGISSGLTAPSSPTYSWVLAGIALTILLLACINFTTLAIGRSASRTREIGLRKVVGAARMQLAGQLGGEAFLTSTLSLGIGLLFATLLLPTFNDLANKQLALLPDDYGIVVLGLLGLLLFVALMSGFYPALVLSRYRPTDMLRKQSRLGGSARLTSALVMVQFTLSVALIAGTVIMGRQMEYLQTTNIGYDRDHVVLVNSQNLDGGRLLQLYRNTLEGRSEFEGITGMTNAFSHGWSRNGWDYKGEQKNAYVYRVESDFTDVMGITVAEGRTFDPNRGTDSTVVIVNQALARDLGLDNPIGERVEGFWDDPEIIGVVDDFNYLSLHQAVEPMMFIMHPDWRIGGCAVPGQSRAGRGGADPDRRRVGCFCPRRAI
jgi:putative ABC transport system permease protein